MKTLIEKYKEGDAYVAWTSSLMWRTRERRKRRQFGVHLTMSLM